MKKGESIVVVVDGGIKGATVMEILPSGDVLTSIEDYYGSYTAIPRSKVFTASEWRIKNENV